MSHTPLGYSDSLRIGTVDFVSADEIKVLLDIDAPDSLSLNSGTPRPFPRINGYVLVPSENGYLVGQVEWITIERSQYPKRKGMQDFGLVDLPYPLRKLSLNPIGTLARIDSDDAVNIISRQFSFRRGVESFPSVGDPVVIPTNDQLLSIIQSGKNRRMKIGTSPIADGAEVMIDPDRLFGRHLAVLGNTGSGKSCSVAGLIRWSFEAAQKESQQSRARFVVLDPNGEYSRAFKGFQNTKIFTVEPSDENFKNLKIPVWFWNSEEWCAFTQASGKTQRPIMRRGLREIRAGKKHLTQGGSGEEKLLELRRYLSSKLVKIQSDLNTDAIKEDENKFGFYLASIAKDLENKIPDNPSYQEELSIIKTTIQAAVLPKFHSFKKGGELIEYYRAFEENAVKEIVNKIAGFLRENGGVIYQAGPSEDCPREFSGAEFADHIQQIGLEEKASQYVDFLVMRIRALLADTRMKSIISPSKDLTLETWLSLYVGTSEEKNGTITIIDLSLVPSEVVHILTTVIARMTFESLQRYRRQHKEKKVLPTVLVMEEAHNFIRRYSENNEIQDAASTCCRLFEKIAREGRKFGLGLVLSSQRPSELSPTVLSQCNTFLLHRISNDKDQDLVHKLVPDNLQGLLRDLPSLPSQNAILLGWATELPVLVRMNDLPKQHQPQSDDPDFWDVWTGTEERKVDWKEIADKWQGIEDLPPETVEEEENPIG